MHALLFRDAGVLGLSFGNCFLCPPILKMIVFCAPKRLSKVL